MLRPSIHRASFIQYLKSLIKVSILNLLEDKSAILINQNILYFDLKPRPMNNDSVQSCTDSQYLRALKPIL